MLGRVVRELPLGDYVYEPKWDGFRCVAFRDGSSVEMRSRHDRPLARYFPEIASALLELEDEQLVLDGELVLATASGPDFTALMARLHPAASRVELLTRETPAEYVAFDLLARGGDDLTGAPFARRRALLEEVLRRPPQRVVLSPQTDDPRVAAEWLALPARGIDGVMAKSRDGAYEPGKRRMLKVKLDRTADCVVAGLRTRTDADDVAASLLLGLYGDDGRLEHVGVASSFGRARGRELFEELRSCRTPLAGHPWERGFLVGGGATGRLPGSAGRWTPEMTLDWVPVDPVRVCEVGYDHVDGARFRHPARFRRWRRDREPSSCRLDQLLEPAQP